MEQSELSILKKNISPEGLDDVVKDNEPSNTLYNLLCPSMTDMLKSMTEVYDTKKKLSIQLDHLIQRLQTCMHLVDPQVLEYILSDSVDLQKRMGLIHKTLKEVQLRVEKCYSIVNKCQQ
ncbi:hypothetical protein PORY_000789 [Pneumocystis oryctolagi]|uniref:Uncharacterized protein n=1 Tax=Pneumocystis oryctolagi TaxID=42067 RepID=A0ACB7CG24_9ASCO|nr:hypothetical protein PORY_000789 [Pneumocystis oryctolagi]